MTYITRSGGSGNCTRRPGLSSGSDHCLCGTAGVGTAGVRSVFGHPDTSCPCVSCARRSDDTDAPSWVASGPLRRIGFHAAAPCSLLNDCHPRPVNVCNNTESMRRHLTLATPQVTRAGWLGSSWRQSASPRRGSLGSGGVARRSSTPDQPEV
jgi:hypothetical protein